MREGARVVFGDVRDDEGKKVEAAIRATGGEAVYVHLDVASEADWRSAVQLTTDRFGALDILVNNAAIVIPRVPIDERTVEEWDRVMAVNARGVFLGTKHAIPAMRRAGGGSIVNISSVAGIGQSRAPWGQVRLAPSRSDRYSPCPGGARSGQVCNDPRFS